MSGGAVEFLLAGGGGAVGPACAVRGAEGRGWEGGESVSPVSQRSGPPPRGSPPVPSPSFSSPSRRPPFSPPFLSFSISGVGESGAGPALLHAPLAIGARRELPELAIKALDGTKFKFQINKF